MYIHVHGRGYHNMTLMNTSPTPKLVHYEVVFFIFFWTCFFFGHHVFFFHEYVSFSVEEKITDHEYLNRVIDAYNVYIYLRMELCVRVYNFWQYVCVVL